MSAKQQLIEKLNDAMAWELAGIVQYLQHSVMVTGPHRAAFKEVFHDGSEEARDHAETVAERIAALGGVPTVEPAKIRQAADLQGMIEATLALERDALAAWEACHEIAGQVNMGIQFWIEEHIAEEQEHVEEFEKLAGEIGFSSADVGGSSQAV